MESKPRGICLIVNIEGEGEMSRQGSGFDVERTAKVFKSLHFKVIEEKDVTAKVSTLTGARHSKE